MQNFNGNILLAPGAAANLLSISTQTLRAYEATGKIKAAMRSPGGQRRYTLAEIERLRETIKEEQKTHEPVDPAVLDSFVGNDIPLSKLF